MLSEAGLSFLLDEADTVLEYENKGKTREREQPGTDPLMSALDNLSRVQQLEIIHGMPSWISELQLPWILAANADAVCVSLRVQ